MAKILIVDDQLYTQADLIAELRKAGHEVDEANDFNGMLDTYRHKKYDMVITDLNMAQGNGFNVISIIRHGLKSNPTRANIPKDDVLPIILHSNMDAAKTEKFKRDPQNQDWFSGNTIFMRKDSPAQDYIHFMQRGLQQQ